MDIYVGNLPYQAGDQDLADLFAPFGEVAKAKVIMDRDSGRSKGFGFVTMNDREQAEAAISQVDGSDMDGRALRVNEARPRTGGPGGGGGGRGDRPPRRDF
ncbi:MAG: RNA recognition motif domain-containing protein [Planctomycetota bacterium]